MAFVPPDLRKYAEEGLYLLVGVSITGALALRRRLRSVPAADEAAAAVTSAAAEVLNDVAHEAADAIHQVRELFGLLRDRASGAEADD